MYTKCLSSQACPCERFHSVTHRWLNQLYRVKILLEMRLIFLETQNYKIIIFPAWSFISFKKCYKRFCSLNKWTNLYFFQYDQTLELKCLAYMVAQKVKRLPAMLETQVRSQDREDPLEKAMAIHSSTLAWKIPWTEEPDRLQSMGSQRVGHHWATSLSLSLVGHVLSELFTMTCSIFSGSTQYGS